MTESVEQLISAAANARWLIKAMRTGDRDVNHRELEQAENELTAAMEAVRGGPVDGDGELK